MRNAAAFMRLGASVISMVIGLTVVPALSQETAIEDIVVTAQKREENLQDVPISVTAFSSAALEARGAT